jgi:hypothetical protein
MIVIFGVNYDEDRGLVMHVLSITLYTGVSPEAFRSGASSPGWLPGLERFLSCIAHWPLNAMQSAEDARWSPCARLARSVRK